MLENHHWLTIHAQVYNEKNVDINDFFLRNKEMASKMQYLKRMDPFGPPDLVAYKCNQNLSASSFQSI